MRFNVISLILECRSELELESLYAVIHGGIQRQGKTDLQRADRRYPRNGQARRIARTAGLELVVDHAGIDKSAHAHRFLVGEPWKRKQELGAADQHAAAAGGIAVDVLRSDRAGLVAAHGGNAAGIEILIKRQRLVAVAAAHPDLAVQPQRVLAPDRIIPVVQVVDLVVLERTAGKGDLAEHALQAAFGRVNQTVAPVTLPAGGAEQRGVGSAESVEEVDETLAADKTGRVRIDRELGIFDT